MVTVLDARVAVAVMVVVVLAVVVVEKVGMLVVRGVMVVLVVL